MVSEVKAGSLPFQEAIDFFRAKVNLPTKTWTDLWQGQHAHAFVVAGATKGALIADFHNAILKALEQGTTLADFRKDFDRIVAAHGWSYNGGRGWRSAVIYNTNLRMAYAAGKWDQVQRLKDRRPYLVYKAILDNQTRPEHRAWHNLVLPVDHPFWKTHYPPNGWNCRCTIVQMSLEEVEAAGLKVSETPPEIVWETRSVNTAAGPRPVDVPEGIDTGFSYNVGEAWGRGAQKRALDQHGAWEPLGTPAGNVPAAPPALVPTIPRAAIGPRAASPEQIGGLLADAIGGDSAVFTDPTGTKVAVTQAIADHMREAVKRQDGREAFFTFIPELLQDPAEIWVGFAINTASGRVALRRRYVSLLEIDKKRVLGVVTDSDDGMWSGVTFFRGEVSALKNLRTGLRIHVREEEK